MQAVAQEDMVNAFVAAGTPKRGPPPSRTAARVSFGHANDGRVSSSGGSGGSGGGGGMRKVSYGGGTSFGGGKPSGGGGLSLGGLGDVQDDEPPPPPVTRSARPPAQPHAHTHGRAVTRAPVHRGRSGRRSGLTGADNTPLIG